ncbi:DUF4376 domain-containing protein [Gallibacterium salpingitidis]|uniref:DUF4376 domain-containing protein n=1 Tax=Gallibacterium salpingitidis TaxID=505341 RepID=UPI0008261BEF|nr:DUF4376 domain-containing protein [Gallibacterium salpingitidis]
MTVQFDNKGFALNSGYITVHTIDNNNIYIGSAEQYISIGCGLAAKSYLDAPPQEKTGFVVQRINDSWQYVADHRGEKVYSIDDGAEIEIKEVGDYPANTTTQKRPTEHHEWNGEEWIINEDEKTKLLNEQCDEMWERIKAYRYQRSLSGVYIESVGKWFQTGEEEKTKYLGLSHVIKEIGSISWKTFENDFIEMTPELLNSIFAEMVRAENADHINAEKHKALMMQSDTPLEYDFSSGWERRYED